jgi:hypothetical protein
MIFVRAAAAQAEDAAMTTKKTAPAITGHLPNCDK